MENILFHFLFVLKQAGRLHLRIRETEIKGANNIKKINSWILSIDCHFHKVSLQNLPDWIVVKDIYSFKNSDKAF